MDTAYVRESPSPKQPHKVQYRHFRYLKLLLTTLWPLIHPPEMSGHLGGGDSLLISSISKTQVGSRWRFRGTFAEIIPLSSMNWKEQIATILRFAKFDDLQRILSSISTAKMRFTLLNRYPTRPVNLKRTNPFMIASRLYNHNSCL